ncbi:Omp28-related outer membrane protein [bacterium]|nr:Omp28-related outer membrane protein [bacterium]
MYYGFVTDPVRAENIVPMVYHDGGDPWSNGDPCHGIREGYYGVGAWPDLEVDGLIGGLHPGVTSQMLNAYNTRIAIESPISIDMMAVGTGNSIDVTATVTSAETAISGNYKIRFALLTNYWDHYTSPTGVSEFHNDVVSMAPDAHGLAFAIEANSTETFQASFSWPESLGGIEIDPENIHVVCFVQNDNGREVLQAEQCELSSDYYFTLQSTQTSNLVAPGEGSDFSLNVTNLGLQDDTYDITVASDLPEGWEFSYMLPDGEQAGDATLDLASAENYPIDLSITTAADDAGVAGAVTFQFTSQNLTQLTNSVTFFVLASGQVLVVNGDTNGDFAEYYSTALEAVAGEIGEDGVSWAVWPRSPDELNVATFTDLPIEAVIWYLGTSMTFDAEVLPELEAFLEGGGNLWMNGSFAPTALFNTTLATMMGTAVQGINTSNMHVVGVEGDVIGNGLDFYIAGGDGADNSGITRTLQLLGGEAALHFNPDQWAAVHNTTETYRTLLFGFPFEAISTQDHRNAMMDRAVRYLLGHVNDVAGPGEGTQPLSFDLSSAWPNPFNPSTSLTVTLPMASDLRVTVHNLVGQQVATLADGFYNAGSHNFSFDCHDNASGIYFIRASAPGEGTLVRKVMLVR